MSHTWAISWDSVINRPSTFQQPIKTRLIVENAPTLRQTKGSTKTKKKGKWSTLFCFFYGRQQTPSTRWLAEPCTWRTWSQWTASASTGATRATDSPASGRRRRRLASASSSASARRCRRRRRRRRRRRSSRRRSARTCCCPAASRACRRRNWSQSRFSFCFFFVSFLFLFFLKWNRSQKIPCGPLNVDVVHWSSFTVLHDVVPLTSNGKLHVIGPFNFYRVFIYRVLPSRGRFGGEFWGVT